LDAGVFLIGKVGVTIGLVLTLSVLAERLSPQVAGLLSGYPLGAALALFFIGLEIGPQFAAQSAVYTLAGLLASLVFVAVYWFVSTRVSGRGVLASSAAALGGYFAAAWLLQLMPFSRTAAAVVPLASVFGFMRLFRGIPNVTVTRRVRFSVAVLLLRACLAAVIITAITAAAGAVGAAWAGLFAAFPTVLFPLMLIVHLSYGKTHVHTIIKNFPPGLGSLIAYCLSVSVLYPVLGVAGGTMLGFAAASLYLLAYGAVLRRHRGGCGAELDRHGEHADYPKSGGETRSGRNRKNREEVL
jgi:uncharacterized membrane protein (GlpM family)